MAPFFGAALAVVVLSEQTTVFFWTAATRMAFGVRLHLTERHEHAHERMEHAHPHVHDEHHEHAHEYDAKGDEPHTHPHRHDALVHTHPHYPDLHHRHRH